MIEDETFDADVKPNVPLRRFTGEGATRYFQIGLAWLAREDEESSWWLVISHISCGFRAELNCLPSQVEPLAQGLLKGWQAYMVGREL